jgi:hypothetical protein
MTNPSPSTPFAANDEILPSPFGNWDVYANKLILKKLPTMQLSPRPLGEGSGVRGYFQIRKSDKSAHAGRSFYTYL